MGLSLIFGLWEIHFQSPFLESAFSDTPSTNCYRLDSPRTKFWDRDLYTGALLGVALGINSCGDTKKQDCVERRVELWVSQNKDHGLSNRALELGWSSRIAQIEAMRLGLYTLASTSLGMWIVSRKKVWPWTRQLSLAKEDSLRETQLRAESCQHSQQLREEGFLTWVWHGYLDYTPHHPQHRPGRISISKQRQIPYLFYIPAIAHLLFLSLTQLYSGPLYVFGTRNITMNKISIFSMLIISSLPPYLL